MNNNMVAVSTERIKLSKTALFLFIYIMPLSLLFDLFIFIFPSGNTFVSSPFTLVKGLMLGIILVKLIPKSSIYLDSTGKYILVFSVYSLLLLLTATNFAYSLKISFSILLPMLFYSVAYNLVGKIVDIEKLSKSLLIFALIIIFNFGLTNILGIQGYDYIENSGFNPGSLADTYNVMTYTLLLAPLWFIKNSTLMKRIFQILVIFALLVLLILSLKRIALAGFLVGFLVFFLFSNQKMKILSVSIPMSVLIVSLLIGFSNIFISRFEYRIGQGRFESNFYEDESRYFETMDIWQESLSFSNPSKSLFGLEAFNTVGFYGGGKYGERQAHIDFNIILNANGIFGLILYLLIYISLFRKIMRFSSLKVRDPQILIFYGLLVTLVVVSLTTSIAGQMYHISFRLILFIFLGALSKIMDSNLNKSFQGNQGNSRNSVITNSR